MSRLLLVLAIGPTFALLLGLAGLSTRRLLLGGPGPVVRIAPVLYAVVVAAAALLAGVLTGFDPVELGLRSQRLVLPGQPGATWWVLTAAICLGVVAGAAGYLLELLLADRALARGTTRPAGTGGPPGSDPGGPGMRSVVSWAGTPWVLVAIGVVTAVSEEVVFRGYLLTGLRADLALWAALAIQAVLFGTHHISFGARAVAAKTAHGLVWAALAVAAGSLLPALAAHLTFQALACRRLVRVTARSPERQVPERGALR